MRCFKLLGERVIARDFDRQVAELQVRAAVLNRFTRLGTPITAPVLSNELQIASVRLLIDLLNKATMIYTEQEALDLIRQTEQVRPDVLAFEAQWSPAQ